MNIIEIEHLHKSFKDVAAVDDLSFTVRKGELFAFLGANGAGKSTTINIISGVLDKDGGKVIVCGENIDFAPDLVKSRIGVVFQNSVLDKRLTAYDNLKSRAALYGIAGGDFRAKLDALDELLDLKELLRRPLCKMSGGQKRRIDIARALLPDPQLLILDEPTTGLDPQTRLAVWNAVEKLRKERELTVFLTTHYMEEAARASYVVILDAGKKAAEGSPHELRSKYATDRIRVYGDPRTAERTFRSLGLVPRHGDDFVEVDIPDTSQAVTYMRKYPSVFKDFEVLKGDMDNVFLKVTGKDIEEA